ncbi:hypothetical protein [Chitinimonas lacunae]|uniref:Uncharacterized protein n=1 Tax=Chitinimonas lacunae TaxID=1963018 RepID=A0ABV8MNI0_9NEIS
MSDEWVLEKASTQQTPQEASITDRRHASLRMIERTQAHGLLC